MMVRHSSITTYTPTRHPLRSVLDYEDVLWDEVACSMAQHFYNWIDSNSQSSAIWYSQILTRTHDLQLSSALFVLGFDCLLRFYFFCVFCFWFIRDIKIEINCFFLWVRTTDPWLKGRTLYRWNILLVGEWYIRYCTDAFVYKSIGHTHVSQTD